MSEEQLGEETYYRCAYTVYELIDNKWSCMHTCRADAYPGFSLCKTHICPLPIIDRVSKELSAKELQRKKDQEYDDWITFYEERKHTIESDWLFVEELPDFSEEPIKEPKREYRDLLAISALKKLEKLELKLAKIKEDFKKDMKSSPEERLNTLENEIASLESAPKRTKKKTKKVQEKPAEEPTKETIRPIRCKYVFSRGPKKNHQCETICRNGKEFCCKHKPKKTSESPQKIDDEMQDLPSESESDNESENTLDKIEYDEQNSIESSDSSDSDEIDSNDVDNGSVDVENDDSSSDDNLDNELLQQMDAVNTNDEDS